MLSGDSVFRLSKDVLKRSENNINNGTVFLYNALNNKLWIGNYTSNFLIELLDGYTSIQRVYDVFKLFFSSYNNDEIKKSFEIVIEELINKNFLEAVNE